METRIKTKCWVVSGLILPASKICGVTTEMSESLCKQNMRGKMLWKQSHRGSSRSPCRHCAGQAIAACAPVLRHLRLRTEKPVQAKGIIQGNIGGEAAITRKRLQQGKDCTTQHACAYALARTKNQVMTSCTGNAKARRGTTGCFISQASSQDR